MKPFFSIVIPTFNRANKIKRTLSSVIAQTFSDFEVLVMDDGSIDDTAAVVAAFNDPRVNYEWDKNSGGPARPRNRGIARAQGEWVCFLDADDWWTPNKLETCFRYINDHVDFLYHDLLIVQDQGVFFHKKKLKSRQVKKPVLDNLLLNGNLFSNSSVVVRRSLLEKIGGINESLEMVASEDYNTWLRISQLSNAFIHIPECLGYYLLHDESISKKDMSLSYERSVREFIGKGVKRERVNSVAGYMSGQFYFSNKRYGIAAQKFKYCLKHADMRIRLRAMYMLMLIAVNKLTKPK